MGYAVSGGIVVGRLASLDWHSLSVFLVPEIGTCSRWGTHRKRSARKSRSSGLRFTVFTKTWRFVRGQALPGATDRYHDQASITRVFRAKIGFLPVIAGK